MGTQKVSKVNKKLIENRKKEKKINIKSRISQAINTVATKLTINKIDCPKSGWSINKTIIELNIIKLKKYLI